MCAGQKFRFINISKYYVWGGFINIFIKYFKEPGCRDTQDVPLDRLVELAEVDAHLHDLGALEIRYIQRWVVILIARHPFGKF